MHSREFHPAYRAIKIQGTDDRPNGSRDEPTDLARVRVATDKRNPAPIPSRRAGGILTHGPRRHVASIRIRTHEAN